MALPGYQVLLNLCEKFITSGSDGVQLSELVDAVNANIPETEGPYRTCWLQHMDALNETWTLVNIEGQKLDWPSPPEPIPAVTKGVATSAAASTTPVTAPSDASQKWSAVLGGTQTRAALRAELKLQLDGGGGVGPARKAALKKGEKGGKGGKPRDDLVDKLVLEEEQSSASGKTRKVVYCVGCDRSTVGRDPARIKKHAQECKDLARDFPTLLLEVENALAKRSHSAKLEANLSTETVSEAGSSSTGGPSDSAPTIKTYMNSAKLSNHAKMRIEWLLFRMLICCALPWSIMTNMYFEEFVKGLNPSFEMPDRSAFLTKHLAQEIAIWTQKFKQFIADKFHLTLSLDGWSTRANDEIYTYHTTTALRRSFFTDGRVFNGVSVTGVALFDVMVEILQAYGPKNYSAVAGDGGPNVRAAKRKLVAAYPWILNVYDPCHNLNLFLKDLGKLFKQLLAHVSAIANYFGKSNYGTHQLYLQRKKDGVANGIKSHSDTRFSSSYQQVLSVHACMGSIKKCMQAGVLKFDTAATKKLVPFIADGAAHYLFMGKMSEFISVLASGANAIVTLEGQSTTCADVFYAWVCIAYDLEQILSTGPSVSRSEILKVYNLRFSQMMKESSSKLFLLSFYLHPMFRVNGGLRLIMPVLRDGESLQPAQFPPLFKTLLHSLLTIFQGEQLRTLDSGSEAVPELIKQFKAYAYNKEPFASHLWDRKTRPLDWWTRLSHDSNARLLSKVAIKLFSISPSEICDERTASRLGWFNSARRSSMTPENLVASAKLYDYYVNGFTDHPTKHAVRVHLSDATTSQKEAPRTAPHLSNLLNSDDIEPHDIDKAALETLWFSNPDPYDLDEVDRANEELRNDLDDPDSEQEPISGDSFLIEDYVKLNDAKLISLIKNVDKAGPGVLLENIAVPSAQVIGKPGEWNVDSFLG